MFHEQPCGGVEPGCVDLLASLRIQGSIERGPFGPGGALFVGDNFVNNLQTATPVYGDGLLTITGGTFSGNVTVEDGGALATGVGKGEVPLAISGVAFTSNSIDPSLSSDTYGDGRGGAIYFGSLFQLECASGAANGTCGPAPATESFIANSTFTGNTAVSNPNNMPGGIALGGGGAIYAEDGLNLTGNTFAGNSTDNEGGAVWLGALDIVPQVTGNKFTANAALDAGALFLLNCTVGEDCGVDPVAATVHYNEIVGNTSSGTNRSGLGIGSRTSSDTNAPVDAAFNFWGCNTGPNTPGCQNAAENGGAGSFTLAPWAVLAASLNSRIPATGSSIAFSGGITADSTGAPLASPSLTAFAGLPATLNILQNGASLTGGPTSLITGANAVASITGNATAGGGSASIAIAQATVTLTFSTPPSLGLGVSLGANAITPSTPVTYTVTLTNSSSEAQTGVAFSSTLPGSLGFDPTRATDTCGGSTAGSTPTLLALSGATLGPHQVCSVAAILTPSTAGTYLLSAGPVTSSPGGTGDSDNVTLLVSPVQPVIALTAPANANRGTAATLTATFTTPDTAVAPVAQLGFYADSTLLGAVTLVRVDAATFTATLVTRDLPGGAHLLTAKYPGDANYAEAVSVDHPASIIANNLWIANSDGTTSSFSATGTPNLSAPIAAGGTGVAIDQAGNVWSLNQSSDSVAEFSNSGVLINPGFTGDGIAAPAALVFDGSDHVWIADGTNSFSFLNSAGAPEAALAYTGFDLKKATGIAVDTSGNLWIIDAGGNSVVEILGVAFPTLAPLAAGITSNIPATAP